MMKYVDIEKIDEVSAEEIMSGDDEEKRVLALISCGMHGEITWARDFVRGYLYDGSDAVRGAAAISLGHLFRRYRNESFEEEKEALTNLESSLSHVLSKIRNALDDYDAFHST